MPKVLLAATLVCFALPALADIAPPDLAQCEGKSEGTACTTDAGKSGACKKATCYRNDYSDGVPPKSVPYECLQCTEGAKVSGSGTGESTASSSSKCTFTGLSPAVGGGGVLVCLLLMAGVWLRLREE